MYLSKVSLPLSHRNVMSAFPDSESKTARADWGILYRIDGQCTLVQSQVEPDWSWLKPKLWQVKQVDYDLANAETYQTRMAINPVVVRDRRRYSCSPAEWLEQRQDALGFTVDIQRVSSEHDREKSRGHAVQVHRAVIDGVLTVTNAERAISSITQGIGKARAYGCGLISIAPLLT